MKLGLATIGVVAAMLLAAPNTVRLDGQARNDQAGSSVANGGDVVDLRR